MEIDRFRADFPEFSDEERYSDDVIGFWAGIVEQRMNPVRARWEGIYDQAVELATAHYVAIAKKNEGAPGSAGGLAAGKSVGGVSVSYDTSAIAVEGAGHWNQTSYGRQYMELAMVAGMGAVQL